MSPTTAVIVLILSLTFDGAFFMEMCHPSVASEKLNNYTSYMCMYGGLGAAKLYTIGFGDCEGLASNETTTYLAKRFLYDDERHSTDYFEVYVSDMDLIPRDPDTNQCLEDSLTFYEGTSTDAPVLVEVCGKEQPTFDTAGLEVLAVLKTNETHQKVYKGASMTFEFIKKTTLDAKRQQLRTFAFPSFGYLRHVVAATGGSRLGTPPLPPPIRRTITIEAGPDPTDVVGAYVTASEMPSGRAFPNCTLDKVVFYDGSDTSAPVLAKVCGTDFPRVRSTGRFMTVSSEVRSMPGPIWKGVTFAYQAEQPLVDGQHDPLTDGGTAGIVNACVVILALITTAGVVY